MKKASLIFLLVFFILHTINLNAQAVKLGVRGGLNISDLSFDPDVNKIFPGMSKSNRTVFLAGGIFQFALTGPVSIQIEPTYINKGTKIEGSNVAFDINNQVIQIDNVAVTYKLEYLEVPVLLHVNIPLPAIQPFAEVGPAVAFNLSSSFTTDINYMGQGMSDKTDNKDNTSSTEFGLVFGAGVEYNITPLVSLMLNGRYALGLTDLSKDQTNTDQLQATNQTIKSTGIQFSLGIMFGL